MKRSFLASLPSLESTLYFFVLFFLPFQVGKHFWPDFSYVDGIRVDYLSPTLHLTDTALFLLFVVFLFRLFLEKRLKSVKISFAVPLVAVGILATFLSSHDQVLHLFGALLYLEAAFFGIFTAYFLTAKRLFLSGSILSFGAIATSAIAFLQFLLQRSVGGPLYFLGERTFTEGSLGIAKINIDAGSILRPYATFPHPNVLAFFLLVSLVHSFYCFRQIKNKWVKTYFFFALIATSAGIFVTFSRLGILALFILVGYYFLSTKTSKHVFFGTLALTLILVASFFNFITRVGQLPQDTLLRIDQLKIATEIFLSAPFFGIGILHYISEQAFYQKALSPIFLQPVHNVYMLVAAETGILGLSIFMIGVMKIIQKSFKRKNESKGNLKIYRKEMLTLLLLMLVIALFDHYFLTLHQGMLLSTFVIGAAVSRIR